MVSLPEAAGMADTEVGLELGKALADRLGLDPNTTDREWSAVQGSSSTVFIRLNTLVRMPESEFNELLQVAQIRAQRTADERRSRRAAR